MALTPEEINDYVSKLFNDPMGELYRLAKFQTEAISKIDKLQGDVKYACQQRDHFGAELGKYQKELVEVRQRRDQLGIENAELHGQLRNRDSMMNVLNDRITELEGENQNLLRRIGELSNSSTYKLQEENERLRKENEALKKGNEESPTTNTEEKGTVTIEAWLIGSSVDKLRLVWATEEYVNALHYTITKRANKANFVGDDPYFAPVKVTL
jgi:regulator of replication initiation timing